MDWLEQWFRIAPDNGDGTLELLLMLVVAAVAVTAILWRYGPSRAALLRFFAARGSRTSRTPPP